ncbi:hypothetical protein RB195_004835 [Necator americanus]|uniref:FANCI helical domain-containing protein n=1 Tax=Necator americanus TaxID=51031 RepID=A0ABR1BLH2_NECAM
MEHSSERSTQNDNSTSYGTQSGGNRISLDAFVNRFIDHGKKFVSKRGSNEEEKFVSSIKVVMQQVAEEKRRDRIFTFLRSTVEKDQAAKVTDFYTAWCHLITVLGQEEQNSCRIAGIRFAFDVLNIQTLLPLYVSNLYDQFVKQVHLCDSAQVLSLLEKETSKIVSLSKIWTSCSLVLLKHLLSYEEIVKDGNVVGSADLIRDLIYDWMEQAATSEVFGAVVTVAQSLPANDLFDKFINEKAAEGLLNEENRPVLTWKCICLMRAVDNKMLNRILREMINAWPKKCGEAPAACLMSSVREIVDVIHNHQNVGKVCCGLFKSDPGMIMCSEFGFLLIFAVCSADRYKAATLSDLTKTFQRLWSFREHVLEFGWMENSCLGEVVDIVEDQVNCLVQRLSEDPEACEVLSDPTITLLQSLLRLPSTKEVTIVDGRVADGCPIWIFASKMLVKLVMSKKKDMAAHLAMMVEMVTTSSTSVVFIYVDMLIEIVRNCPLEVLNNWRELERLFKSICHIRYDVSSSLVRCLMPIISNRSQLRELLLQTVKQNLLDFRRANAVIPILMLLLRSFSKRSSVVAGSQMSQSFATFSSQSLQAMGCKRKVDETVCLEVIGLLKRCLTQWTPTKTAVYLGFAEEGTRNSSVTGQCLDLLVSHAATAPEWKAETMVTSAGAVVSLVEPLPQLVQAMQCLLNEEIAADITRVETAIGVNVQKCAVDLIDSWVEKACSEDVHDLGVDKLSEWNPTTPAGAANLVFAKMMLNLYDVLIEHVWKQFHNDTSAAKKDRLKALIGRKGELQEVLQEKYVRRKEAKATTTEDRPALNVKQADVLISASTIAQILENTVPEEASLSNDLEDINCELLEWAIERMLDLSLSLLDGFHPLHTVLCGTNAMISAAGYLLDFYMGTNCVDWIQSRQIGCASKTKALETYGNIVQYLSTKYKSQPSKVVVIWKKSDMNATSVRDTQRSLTANGSLVRHCHLFMTKLFPATLIADRGEGEEKRRTGLELERQARIMFKICATLVKMMDNPKCFMTIFKFTMAMLEKNVVGNNLILRGLLKLVCTLAMKCIDSDSTVERALSTIADDLIQVLSEEDDKCKYKFVEHASHDTICEFLASSINKSLLSVQTVISFAGAFQIKDQRMDEVLLAALTKCDQCCELTTRLLPLHSQFAVQRETLVQTLTTLFNALQELVDLMLCNVKAVPEMIEWKSLGMLSKLLKEKLQSIMAIADEHVGVFNPADLKNRKKNSVRKDEVIYVKYVRAREALQSRVLLMCEALREDRLNFQVKKNTIGMRDFRINLNTLRTRVVQNEEEEAPTRKKKRASQSMDRPEDHENREEETRSTEMGEDTTMDIGERDSSQRSVVY